MKNRDVLVRLTGPLLLLTLSSLLAGSAAAQVTQTPLPGKSIPKWIDPLPTFVGTRVSGTVPLTVTAREFQQPVLPASIYAPLDEPFNAGTYVWGYEIKNSTTTYGPHYPGFTIEAQVGTPTTITYINALTNPVLQNYIMVDQTIHWADPLGQMGSFEPYTGPVPMAPHLHGGYVPSAIDGGPDAWFTPNDSGPPAYTGSAYNATVGGVPVGNVYTYPNDQEPTTIWFHDHALGATRLNVYAGLAAFYFLRGGADTGVGNALGLPADPYEVEIAIQDRMFDTNGQWLFPHEGDNPTIHPFWVPEFFGDAIVVNGKTWPYFNVEPRRYRFRLLDGSNARFYRLTWGTGVSGPTIWQIGTDGGLLDVPVAIPVAGLLMAPGERADVIIDFTKFAGKTLTLMNAAKAPYPGGKSPDQFTTGQILQFRVAATATSVDNTFNPAAAGATLRSTPLVKLVDFATGTPAVTADVKRVLTLNEIMAVDDPQEILVNNTKWMGEMSPNAGGVTELPQQGATELWQIVNTTADTHPMHLHLVQFQLVSRQSYQANKYMKAYNAAFTGGVSPIDGLTYAAGAMIPGYGPPLPYASTQPAYFGGNPDPTPYLQGTARAADPNEHGWKDTVKMWPGEVTTILVRFAPQDVAAGTTVAGTNYFSFDPTEGPGYVWHCHIVDHEDNEMMRPYQIIAGAQPSLVALGEKTVPMPAATGAFSLEQNSPNPFNPLTEIRFTLPQNGRVALNLYNVRGQRVQNLIDGDAPAGLNVVKLDASKLSSGVYFYRLESGSNVAIKKMILAK